MKTTKSLFLAGFLMGCGGSSSSNLPASLLTEGGMDRFGDESSPLDVTLPFDALVTLSNTGSPPDLKDCFRFKLPEAAMVTVVTTPDIDTDDELDYVTNCVAPADPGVTFKSPGEIGSSIVSCSGIGYKCGGDWLQSSRSSCENETHMLPAGTTVACVQAALPGRVVERMHFLIGAPVPLHAAQDASDPPGPNQAMPISLDEACPKSPDGQCAFRAFALDPPGDTDCFQIIAPKAGSVSAEAISGTETSYAMARFWKDGRFDVPLNRDSTSAGISVKAGEKVIACVVSMSTTEKPQGMMRIQFQ